MRTGLVMTLCSCLMSAAFMVGCSSETTDEIRGSGTAEGVEVTVSAKTGGEILRFYVDEGSAVQKGDTLAIIDHSLADIEFRNAGANVLAAEAQLSLVQKGTRDEEILQAEANLKNATEDHRRISELQRGGSASTKQLDDASTRLVIAQQSYDKLFRGSRKEEILTARARHQQALAQADLIQEKLNDARVLSPVSGTVTLRPYEEGELVSPGATLMKITDLTDMRLTIYLSELELPFVSVGQPVNVFLDALPNEPITGTVSYISPTAEFTPKNIQTREERTKLVFAVKISVPNNRLLLKSGMPADAVIDKRSKP